MNGPELATRDGDGSISGGVVEGPARFDWRQMITANPDTPADVIAALDGYFAPFAAVPFVEVDGKRQVGDIKCVECGRVQNPGLLGLFQPGFEWGLAHGEGRCSECGWPARAYHYIKDASGEEIITIRGLVLQYHPSVVNSPEVAR